MTHDAKLTYEIIDSFSAKSVKEEFIEEPICKIPEIYNDPYLGQDTWPSYMSVVIKT